MTARLLHRWTPGLLAGTMLATFASGCGSPAAPTNVTTEVFSGTVAVGGVDTRTFQVTYSKLATDGAMAITSLTTADGTPVLTRMGLGFGSVNANGVCRLDAGRTTATAQVNQILTATGMFAAGTYCIQVFDPGTLTEPLTYTVVIEHY